MNKLLRSFFILMMCTIALVARSKQGFAQEVVLPQDEYLEGTIISLENRFEQDPTGETYLIQSIDLNITKGSLEGQQLSIENNTISQVGQEEYQVGDKVMILHSVGYEGGETYFITDYVRRDGLLRLFIAFVVLAIGIGGMWGLRSLVGMGFSFLVIFQYILPRILDGDNAVLAAVIGSAIIIPVTFGLSHGFNKKTTIAGVSTVITLAVTGLLAHLFVEAVHLTGYGSEEAAFLQYQLGETLNVKGLLLAGIIIASLGVLDDITISQVSIVRELAKANASFDAYELFKRAMNVGRDHIASLINTLVLAYTGASLPLLLLFINNPSPLSEIVNLELIADEIVRTLVGSMGLILAVPITTLLAAKYMHSQASKTSKR